MLRREGAFLIAGVLVLVGCAAATQVAQAPGVRGGPPGAGGPLPGLTSAELAFFQAGLATFREVEAVKDGLGPRFNLDSCAGCHKFPSVGGSSGYKSASFRGAHLPGESVDVDEDHQSEWSRP